jgi:hypothetical protein
MKIKKEILHNKNNRKEKINSFLNNLVWFLGIVFVLHEIIAPPIYKKNLLSNPKYAIARIEYFTSTRFSSSIHYQYYVNEKKFKGRGKRYSLHKEGDAILIVYDTTNYRNSKTYLDLTENKEDKNLLPAIPDSLKKWR